MRDALSLADQCLAFCGDHVTTQNVYDVLGSMEDSFLFDIADALLGSDAPKTLRLLDGIVQGGRDLSVFAADLSAHFRALLLAKTCGKCEDLLDCTEDMMKRYLQQATAASEAQLTLAVDRLLAAQNDMRYLPAPRTMLESALIHICRPEDALSLTNIEARVDRLESQLKDGVPVRERPVKAEPAPEPKPAQKPEPNPKLKPKAQAEPDDSAPWPEEAPPVQFSEIVAPVPKASAPAVKAAAQSKPAPVAGSGDATAIWRETIAAIPNMFIQALAREAVALKFDQNILTIGFTHAQEMKQKSLSAPINFEPTQRALQSIRTDAKLIITTATTEPASEAAEALAKELFGDKLTIE